MMKLEKGTRSDDLFIHIQPINVVKKQGTSNENLKEMKKEEIK